MKIQSLFFTAAALGGITFLAACGDDTAVDDPDADPGEPPDAEPGPQTIVLNDPITEDMTFEADNTYILPRLQYVFVEPGATLTIEPGAEIRGQQGSVLVVTRGAKIEAVGTVEDPIVFTSDQAAGSKTPGYWGGVLILGAAPINVNTLSNPTSLEATFEAFTSAIPEGFFGGDEENDDSGTLKYVRIEFGGFNFVSDREFNNLTLCGVGSGTEIDFVQLHAGNDDGIELFGGTVDVKHIVSSQNRDDGFDTDNGWVGRGQFIIVQNVLPDGSREASNGYESDNHAVSASYIADPRTLPTIYNVSILGNAAYTGGSSFATVLRRGTGGHYYNHVITGFPNGIELRDSATNNQVTAGNLHIQSSIFFNNDAANDADNWPAPPTCTPMPCTPPADFDEEGIFMGEVGHTGVAWNNQEVDPGLDPDSFDAEAPVFALPNNSAALTGGATPPSAGGFFDTAATFIGAFGATDWTTGWTAYPQD